MKPVLKKLGLGVGIYLLLWAATWRYASEALYRQLYTDALPEWRAHRQKVEEWKKERRGYIDRPGWEKGPMVEVELCACPAPFFIKASCGKSVGSLYGGGWESWCLVTPWRIYQLTRKQTWVS